MNNNELDPIEQGWDSAIWTLWICIGISAIVSICALFGAIKIGQAIWNLI